MYTYCKSNNPIFYVCTDIPYLECGDFFVTSSKDMGKYEIPKDIKIKYFHHENNCNKNLIPSSIIVRLKYPLLCTYLSNFNYLTVTDTIKLQLI